MSSTAPTSKPPLLLVEGVTKTFDGTCALAGADFELREREIHGLVGASGAGTSTLCKVIAGHHAFGDGKITYRGYDIRLRNPRDALRVGIAIVTQDASLVPDMTVLENIDLPLLGRPGRLDRQAARARALDMLSSLGQADALPMDREARHLSPAQRQLVEIAKALGTGAKLIVLDEPTASLSPCDVDRLFDVMSRLRRAGRGLVLVSRRLDEIFSITDRVTVLREGRTTLNGGRTAELTPADLIGAMAGADPWPAPAAPRVVAAARVAPLVLEVRNLASTPAVRDVSFTVGEGEIVGLGGLDGAGRSDVVEAVFGLRPRTPGSVLLNGEPLKPDSPRASVRAGLGFVAADRRMRTIVPDLSARENLLLARLGAHGGFGLGGRPRDNSVEAFLGGLGLSPDRLAHAAMPALSCGMQRTIIIARWLLLAPKVLILDEPTRGVDIATRTRIHGMLREVARKGTAVILVSSDFGELLGLCDRVVAISDGRSTADLPSAALDERTLTLLATPRMAMARNTMLLDELTGENGGVGFWALIEDERLICLNRVVADESVDPGFNPGEARVLDDTLIPLALRRRDGAFVAEADAVRATALVPIRSPRGHDLGWVGLTVPAGDVPPASMVRVRVEALAASL